MHDQVSILLCGSKGSLSSSPPQVFQTPHVTRPYRGNERTWFFMLKGELLPPLQLAQGSGKPRWRQQGRKSSLTSDTEDRGAIPSFGDPQTVVCPLLGVPVAFQGDPVGQNCFQTNTKNLSVFVQIFTPAHLQKTASFTSECSGCSHKNPLY